MSERETMDWMRGRIVELIAQRDAAAEAAREAVAEQALEWAYRQLAHDHHYGFPLDPKKPDGVAFIARGMAALPTPTAALQRVREEEAKRALQEALFHPCRSTTNPEVWFHERLAALFPPAPQGEGVRGE